MAAGLLRDLADLAPTNALAKRPRWSCSARRRHAIRPLAQRPRRRAGQPAGQPAGACYRVTDDGVNPPAAEDWLDGASDRSETWWTDWAAWLGERSGELKRAPKRAGNRRHAVLGPAPGTYVLED
jgi:hypothetical protein